MRTNMRFRRKNCTDRAFPLHFTTGFADMVMTGGILSGLVLYFYMALRLGSGPEVMYHDTLAVLMPAIVLVFITAYLVLLLSHRIDGPLYRPLRIREAVLELKAIETEAPQSIDSPSLTA